MRSKRQKIITLHSPSQEIQVIGVECRALRGRCGNEGESRGRVLSLESAKKTEKKWEALTQPKASGVLRSRLPEQEGKYRSQF